MGWADRRSARLPKRLSCQAVFPIPEPVFFTMRQRTPSLSLACAGLLLLAAASAPALAESSVASSASQSLSTSVGSASTSIQKSSDSSSKDERVAQGDYKVIEMAEVAEQPGLLRVRLQAAVPATTGKAGEFFLLLPRQAAENGRLAEGKLVTAQTRPYGLEFAATETRQAFFLVLDDDWHRELQSRPVVL